jgi:hypothetical protein
VTRERVRIATSIAAATLALLIALGTGPIAQERIIAAYVLVLAAIALAAMTRLLRSAEERPSSLFDAALRARPGEALRPPELVRTEREIMLGSASAGHLQARLLPILRDAAAARLMAAHNVDLDRRPDAARSVLGEDAWELLRPDRPQPDDRNAPGVSLKRLRATIDTLEAL